MIICSTEANNLIPTKILGKLNSDLVQVGTSQKNIHKKLQEKEFSPVLLKFAGQRLTEFDLLTSFLEENMTS